MKKRKNRLYYFLKFIYKNLMKILFRPTFLGVENIPENRAIIFAGNHRHALDPLLIMMSNKSVVHYLAKKELFKGFHGFLFSKIGIIKVDRDKSNPLAIKEAQEVLKNGEMIGIFPEGTRNKTEEDLLRFRYGAVNIAKKSNTTIVPFAIRGKYKLFRKGIILEYGKPINVQDMEIDDANTYLRNEVLDLYRK